jgi:DNA-binding transcriptional regulator YiaG
MKKVARNASEIAARHPLHVRWSDEDDAYLGSIPGLIGDCCHGDSPEQVLVQLKEIAEDLVTHLMSQGSDLPQPAIITQDPEPKAIRLALGLSQIGFAQVLGISPKTLHKWEQGTSRPSGAARTLLKIAASDPSTVKRALAAS